MNPLDGQDIKLSGYLLPLRFSESGETDFLLVPYVGACIHTPPPPPNQIVFVRLAEKFMVQDLFIPVSISGKMQAKASDKSLDFVDGQRDVAIGYQIDGAEVEVYEE